VRVEPGARLFHRVAVLDPVDDDIEDIGGHGEILHARAPSLSLRLFDFSRVRKLGQINAKHVYFIA
jgi:hypothetical protein